MPLPFFTIGHSTRTIEEFVELLRAGDVRVVVDVRTIPRSRTNPQFNEENLGPALAQYQIDHARIAELGGLRSRAANVPAERNGWWQNQSFHNYADYAQSPQFRAGLSRLVGMGRSARVAVMCSEAVWWRCHRRIIADYLIAAGEEVIHLMDGQRLRPATLTTGALVTAGQISYPAPTLTEAKEEPGEDP